MAKPPGGYKGPNGYPCGKGWKHALLVTGELPGTNGFGKNLTRTIAPTVPDLLDGKDKIGWGTEYEEMRRDQMLDRIETLVDQLKLATTILSPKEIKSIEWLIDQALSELDAAHDVHLQWDERKTGSFPLWQGDKLADFAAANGDWCTDPENVLSPPGPQYGAEVPAKGGEGTVVCPTRTELKRRPKDRKVIFDRFVDAAHNIRCAEFGLWRLSLYRQALKNWYDSSWGDIADDIVAKPSKPWIPGKIIAKPGPGGPILTSEQIPDPPPPIPPDAKLPPAGPPVDPGSGKTGPEGLGGSISKKTVRRRSRGPGLGTAAVVTAAAVGLYAVTR